MPESMLRSSIRQLERFGIVEVDCESVRLRCPLPLDMVEIVAYEGKLRNWRKAAWQARNAIIFATSSRIVMPELAARRAMRIQREFQAFGIGVIGFAEDDRHRVILRGRKRRPLCRMSYYQAVGKFWTVSCNARLIKGDNLFGIDLMQSSTDRDAANRFCRRRVTTTLFPPADPRTR